MDIFKIKTETIRVSDKDISKTFEQAPFTPNCGLSCYLAEALIKSKITDASSNNSIKEVIEAVIAEGQKYDRFENKLFWGWEKQPTIKGVTFPFDWDDTAKALDFLHTAKKYGIPINFNQQILNELEIETLFKEALFFRKEIGEDKKISCPFQTALFVFFGPGSKNMDKRDDPMVTVATVRMLAKWYPNVVLKNRKNIIILINRAIYTLNYLLINKTEKFEDYSRYYFSLGHFAFRLIETINYLNGIGVKINFKTEKFNLKVWKRRQVLDYNRIKKQVESSCNKIGINLINNEYFWWYLIGLKLKLITLQNDFKEAMLNKCQDRLIFQHRRLNHQYYSNDWEKKLLFLELNIYKKNF